MISQNLKVPILNNHTSRGLYKAQWLPTHYAWISHLILGILSVRIPIIIPLFVIYQVSQMVMKGRFWDDLVDIVEFFIGREYLSIFLV